jgi:hypothetical protein
MLYCDIYERFFKSEISYKLHFNNVSLGYFRSPNTPAAGSADTNSGVGGPGGPEPVALTSTYFADIPSGKCTDHL